MSTVDAPVPTLPLVRRLVGTFVAPRSVFASLRERPQLLGALLILLAVNLVATLLLLDVIAQDQAAAMEAKAEMTPEQQAQAMKMVRISIPIVAVLGNLVIIFVLAGVYLFLANILLGGATRYKTMLAAMAHVGLVGIPSSIVRVPLMLAKGTSEVTLSPAAFMSTEGGKGFLYHLMTQFDLFNLWMIGLSAVAVSVLGGVPTRKAVTAVCVVWAVLLPIFALLSSKFGQGS